MLDKINYDIICVNYDNREGKLNVEASGVVKSCKFFPTYNLKGQNYIFKPLSKTKPLTTPLFSYAEVIWSNIINEYFMPCPLYQLSICHGYENNESKYYDYGTLVPNILSEGEHLVNLLEYYRMNPDDKVDIDNYINYCMLFYDYTDIFKSKIFKENIELAEQLAMHVLVSILKGDQNYHYENVAFVCDNDNNIKGMAPMIDHEFSTIFLFPDNLQQNTFYFLQLIDEIFDNNTIENRPVDFPQNSIINNLKYIRQNFPNVVKKFVDGLKLLKNDIPNLCLKDYGFIRPCNSYNYKIGIERFKNNNEETAKYYENALINYTINLEELNKVINMELNIIIDSLIKFFS